MFHFYCFFFSLGLSYKKYSGKNIKNKWIHKNHLHHKTIAVVTESDLIPQVDHQVGLVQTILCDFEEKSHQNACHMLEGTICNILKHCGDSSPGRFADCEFSFSMDSFHSFLWGLVRTYKWIVIPLAIAAIIFVILATLPEML